MNQVEYGPAVSELVDRLRSRKLDPVPNYLLLRDIIGLQADDRELQEAAEAIPASKWIQRLVSAQWPDGSWGRLHSADTASAQSVPTTEIGVERGVSLGLGANSPAMRAAGKYLEAVLHGKMAIRDPREKNDRWPLGVELFAASTLAQIKPAFRAIDQAWERWSAIATHSVQSGQYQAKDELEAHRRLTGVSVEGSYLRLSSKYALTLLGSRWSDLPAAVEQALFDWIWQKESGIGYYGQKVSEPPGSGHPGAIERWLRSQELLSLLPSWRGASPGIIEWLWESRDSDGLFDLGPRSKTSVVLPYSESWRRRGARQVDWSVRICKTLTSGANSSLWKA